MEEIVNIRYPALKAPFELENVNGVNWRDNRPLMQKYGWRAKPAIPPVAEGYVRGPVTYVEGDGTTAQAVYTDTSIADIYAAQATAEAVALAAQQAAEAAALAAPFRISPVALCRGLRALGGGREEAFEAMLDTAPANVRKDWDRCSFIMSDDPDAVAMLPYLAAILGAPDAMPFLRTCKWDATI